MTCIVAMKDSEGVVVGCDTRLSVGNQHFPMNRAKWVKYDNFLIAFAGNVSGHNVLERLRADLDFRSLGVQNRRAIDRIVLALRTYMGEEGYSAPSEYSTKTDCVFLLCTESRIFLINSDFSWVDVGDSFAIGSGSDFAAGAIAALNEVEKYQGHQKIDIKFKVGMALNVACQNDVYCSKPLIVKAFTEVRNR